MPDALRHLDYDAARLRHHRAQIEAARLELLDEDAGKYGIGMTVVWT